MADKSRERNYVDAFSDYGMDERQIAIQNRIISKCFKLMFYSVTILTLVWLCAYIIWSVQVSCAATAISFYAAAMLWYSVYVIWASKYGVINGIVSFGFENRGKLIGGIIFAVLALAGISGLMATNEPVLMSEVFGIASSVNIIEYFCGKRNFKVLDEQASDDTENSEEE